MALFKIIPADGGQIGIWQLTESSDELLAYFSSEEPVDPDYLKYSYEKRKVEWLATRVLLKQMLGAEFKITYSELGKPSLTHFNYKFLSISHSREFVAVYIHSDCELGIDLECISRNYNSIERRYLSDTEIIHTNGNPVLQCLYWCAKEAIFKLVPDEGIEFREHIQILPFDPEKDNHFTVRFTFGSILKVYMLYFQLFENHCLVWVKA